MLSQVSQRHRLRHLFLLNLQKITPLSKLGFEYIKNACDGCDDETAAQNQQREYHTQVERSCKSAFTATFCRPTQCSFPHDSQIRLEQPQHRPYHHSTHAGSALQAFPSTSPLCVIIASSSRFTLPILAGAVARQSRFDGIA